MAKDGIGFAYRYNTASVDPQPFYRKVLERVEELKQDFKESDYLKMLAYIAELEIKNEHETI